MGYVPKQLGPREPLATYKPPSAIYPEGLAYPWTYPVVYPMGALTETMLWWIPLQAARVYCPLSLRET